MRSSISAKAKSALYLVLAVFASAFLAGENVRAQSSKSNGAPPFYKSNTETRVFGSFNNQEYAIYALVNGERRKRRLADLSWDDRLARVARNFSQQMARGQFFSHYDVNGKSVADRVKSASIKGWNKIGENLFYSHGTSNYNDLAVKGWMRSAGHRQNILDNSWDATGIGVAQARDGRIYITQIFISN